MRRDAGVDRVGARAHLASLLSAILRCVERYVKRVVRLHRGRCLFVEIREKENRVSVVFP
mgnify:FL=1